MKTMIIAFVAMFALAIGADLALEYAGYSTEERTSGDAVRLG